MPGKPRHRGLGGKCTTSVHFLGARDQIPSPTLREREKRGDNLRKFGNEKEDSILSSEGTRDSIRKMLNMWIERPLTNET